jgi:hypothetical protein
LSINFLQHTRDFSSRGSGFPIWSLDCERGEGLVEDTSNRIFLPEPASEFEKVAKKVITGLGKNTLWVILDGLESVNAVADAHDDAALLREGGNGEIGREGFNICTEGMIPGGVETLGEPSEASTIVVSDLTQFSMHDFTCITGGWGAKRSEQKPGLSLSDGSYT